MVDVRAHSSFYWILQFWVPMFSPGRAVWRLGETGPKLQPWESLGSCLCSWRAVWWEVRLGALLFGIILKAVEIHYRWQKFWVIPYCSGLLPNTFFLSACVLFIWKVWTFLKSQVSCHCMKSMRLRISCIENLSRNTLHWVVLLWSLYIVSYVKWYFITSPCQSSSV